MDSENGVVLSANRLIGNSISPPGSGEGRASVAKRSARNIIFGFGYPLVFFFIDAYIVDKSSVNGCRFVDCVSSVSNTAV